MPNLKASKKGVKVIAKKTENNNNYAAKVKNCIKKCDKAISAGKKDDALKYADEVQKNIDKAVIKGIIKKNTADRQKIRLASKIKGME